MLVGAFDLLNVHPLVALLAVGSVLIVLARLIWRSKVVVGESIVRIPAIMGLFERSLKGSVVVKIGDSRRFDFFPSKAWSIWFTVDGKRRALMFIGRNGYPVPTSRLAANWSADRWLVAFVDAAAEANVEVETKGLADFLGVV